MKLLLKQTSLSSLALLLMAGYAYADDDHEYREHDGKRGGYERHHDGDDDHGARHRCEDEDEDDDDDDDEGGRNNSALATDCNGDGVINKSDSVCTNTATPTVAPPKNGLFAN